MVQLSVNVDGKDQVKKPCEDTVVPIPEKPGVRVKRGRRCSKVAIGVTVVTILVLLAVGAALLGVFLRHHNKSLKDCFKWNKGHDGEEWDSGDSDSNSQESNSGEHGHGPGHGHEGSEEGDDHGGLGDGDGPGHGGGPGDGDGHGPGHGGPGDGHGPGHGGPGDGDGPGHGGPGDGHGGDDHDGGHTGGHGEGHHRPDGRE